MSTTASSNIKKSSQQNSWILRYKCPEEFPNIAKFNDEINWKTAVLPAQMYFNQEELKEESDQNVVKDQEYYKRKRKNRRFYRKKSTLILEDSSTVNNNQLNCAPTGLRFEGHMLNMGFADNDDVNNKGSIKEEVPFRYVLLQFIKKETENSTEEGGSTTTNASEINVIPVGDMYAFKKSNLIPDELLFEIDEKIVIERQRMKDNISRYKGISHSLINSEKNRILREEGGRGEFVGGFESSSLFGSAMNKAFATGTSKKNRSNNRLSTNISDGFENGHYIEEEKEFDWCEGDYNTRCADDEEDNIVIEQANLDDVEASEMSSSHRYETERDGDEAGGDDDENEEDDDIGENEDESEGGQDGGGEITDISSGIIDQSILNSAVEARKLIGHLNTKNIGSSNSSNSLSILNSTNTSSTTTTFVKSAMKRSRDSFESQQVVNAPVLLNVSSLISSNIVKSKVSFNTLTSEVNETSTSNSTSRIANNVVAATQQTSSEYPLTETGLRLFISNRGGKATIKELQFFKPQIKEYSNQVGNKSAGRERFLNILEKITVNVEDPILGNVLCLK